MFIKVKKMIVVLTIMVATLVLSAPLMVSASNAEEDSYYYGFSDESNMIYLRDASKVIDDSGNIIVEENELSLPLEDDQVAYCYNMKKILPHGNFYLLRKEPEAFFELVNQDAVRIKDYQLLKDAVLTVVDRGYPNDSMDLSLGLSDEQFYKITQNAVWYFTDGIDFNENYIIEDIEKSKNVFNQLIKEPYDLHHLDLNVYEIIDDHKVQHLLNAGKRKNIQVPIIKKDLKTNEPLEGAKIQILKDQEIVFEGKVIKDLVIPLAPGTYTLKEVKAPINYETIDDITFHVLSTGGVLIDNEYNEELVIYNKLQTKSIEVHKTWVDTYINHEETILVGLYLDGELVEEKELKIGRASCRERV